MALMVPMDQLGRAVVHRGWMCCSFGRITHLRGIGARSRIVAASHFRC